MGTAVALDKAGAGGAVTPHTRAGGAQPPRPSQAGPQCSDYRQVAPRSKRSSDLFESSNKSRVVGLVCLTMWDLAVHLYTVAVSSFSLHLAVANLHQVPTYPAEALFNWRGSNSSSTENSNTTWWNQEVTVLGKAKWTMSFTHFVLLFAIFHIVYGTIAAICDLMFFHTLVKQTVRVRYVSTVLPVHRLFFVVICWIDGVLFVTSTNITALIDPWAVALVFLVMIAATVDAGLVGLVLLNALYTLVIEYLEGFTWEAGPSLTLIALSLILPHQPVAHPPREQWGERGGYCGSAGQDGQLLPLRLRQQRARPLLRRRAPPQAPPPH